MAIYNQNSRNVTIFHGFSTLEEGSRLAGFSALIQAHDLKVPMPDHLCAIGNIKNTIISAGTFLHRATGLKTHFMDI